MNSKAKASGMKQNSNRKLTPTLRFPEFRDEPGWKEAQLEDLISTVTPPKKLQTSQYLPAGNFPIIDQSQDYICGWTNDDGAVINESLPLIIFGDHTCVLKLANQQFAQGADGIKVFKAKSVVSTEYLYHFLSFRPLLVEDYKRHFSALKEKSVFYSDLRLGEQQKIAACLSSLDEVIAAQTRKVDKLKAHKNGLLQQLLPRQGEALPRFRFPEFRSAPEWEAKKAGDLFSNRIEDGEEGLPLYSVTMNDGMVKRSSLDRDFDDIADPAGNKKAQKNDIAYNTMRMWQGALGVAFEDCMVSPAYVVLSPREEVLSKFFAYVFKLPQYLQLLTSHSRGLTKDRLRLYYKDFALVPLHCPAFAEQKIIADLLSSVDTLIAAQSQKLDLLRIHKSGLMQRLFPLPAEVVA